MHTDQTPSNVAGRRRRRILIGATLVVLVGAGVPSLTSAQTRLPETGVVSMPPSSPAVAQPYPVAAQARGQVPADSADAGTTTQAPPVAVEVPVPVPAAVPAPDVPAVVTPPAPQPTPAPSPDPVPAPAPEEPVVVDPVVVDPGTPPVSGDPTIEPAPPYEDGDTDAAVRLYSVTEFGAVGNGVTDDTAALQRAFDAARDGDVVVIPDGRTFVQADVLTVRRDGITITGGGTVLATREARSSFVLAADRVTLDDVTLRISNTTRRWDAYEQQRLRIAGHTGITVRDVQVIGSAAAGMYIGNATSNFLIERVSVSDTRADGIHMTQGAHDGRVVAPYVHNVGDDGVAVVSYRQDGAPCARIEVVSPRVDGTSGGRGLSIVGGTDVTWLDVDVRNTYAAALFIAAEGNWGTTGVARVRVLGGTVVNANDDTTIDHGSVMLYNGTNDLAVEDVLISDIAVTGYRGTMSRVLGLIANTPAGAIRNITLQSITITGDSRPAALVSNQPTSQFSMVGVTRNGRGFVQQGGYFR